jgi:membrane-bound ClpP family serine protease
MINSLLPIIGIIAVVFIILKFFGSIIKGILTLALIAVVFMVCLNLAHGTPLLNTITPKIQAQVQQQTANKQVSTILQKIKGLNPKQMKTFFKNSQGDIVKYDLAIKQAFAKPNQVQ